MWAIIVNNAFMIKCCLLSTESRYAPLHPKQVFSHKFLSSEFQKFAWGKIITACRICKGFPTKFLHFRQNSLVIVGGHCPEVNYAAEMAGRSLVELFIHLTQVFLIYATLATCMSMMMKMMVWCVVIMHWTRAVCMVVSDAVIWATESGLCYWNSTGKAIYILHTIPISSQAISIFLNPLRKTFSVECCNALCLTCYSLRGILSYSY